MLHEVGTPVNLTASAQLGGVGRDLAILGFYVNSTSSGTIVLAKEASGGTAISGTITPAIGFHRFPCSCPKGAYVTIGGTLNVTFFIIEGQS